MPGMTDEKIIELFFARDERAIEMTKSVHGKLINSICRGILHSERDEEECANDVLLSLWRSIPPQKPENLPAYLTRITRNAALNMRKSSNREKRNKNSELPLDDFYELYSDERDVDEQIEQKELKELLGDFIKRLPDEQRRLFVLRYYFEMDTKELAKRFRVSRRAIYQKLDNLKTKLKDFLESEGYWS